eukprot:scaffold123137_cov98-Phaeocystis_antarctica.AAC.1
MVLGDGCLTLRRDECRRLAHTLLASHVFNGASRRLPHAQARWVPMVRSVWYSLAHTVLASHAFNGSLRRLPHAQARWVPMVLVWSCLAHTLLASHASK